MILGAALFAIASCAEIRPVPVYLAVNAALDPAALRAAREEASWILGSLCVEIEWRAVENAESLWIRVLPGPVSAGSTPDALGLAMPNLGGGNRGAVFLDRIRERVEGSGKAVSLPILLGAVVAHEIGHLLLRSTAHSAEGVMVADYGKAEMAKASQRHLIFMPAEREAFIRQRRRSTPPRPSGAGAGEGRKPI